MGIEGLPGFALYFLQHLACIAPIVIKTGLDPNKFYMHGCVLLIDNRCCRRLFHAVDTFNRRRGTVSLTVSLTVSRTRHTKHL